MATRTTSTPSTRLAAQQVVKSGIRGILAGTATADHVLAAVEATEAPKRIGEPSAPAKVDALFTVTDTTAVADQAPTPTRSHNRYQPLADVAEEVKERTREVANATKRLAKAEELGKSESIQRQYRNWLARATTRLDAAKARQAQERRDARAAKAAAKG